VGGVSVAAMERPVDEGPVVGAGVPEDVAAEAASGLSAPRPAPVAATAVRRI
jgi:hypothetical protein